MIGLENLKNIESLASNSQVPNSLSKCKMIMIKVRCQGGNGANEGDMITTQRCLRAYWLGAPQNIQ